MKPLILTAITVFTAGLALLSFGWLDVPAAEAAYRIRDTWLHGLARRLGSAGEIHWYLVPALLLALLWRKSHPPRARKAMYFFAAVAVAGLAALLLKAGIGRTRPLLLMESGEHAILFMQFQYEHMAFPSGHATTAFAGMTALAILFPKAWLPLMGVAAVLAAARLVSLSHYLSDVVVGAWLGAVTALLLAPYMLSKDSRSEGEA